MRWILISSARVKRAGKPGGGQEHVPLDNRESGPCTNQAGWSSGADATVILEIDPVLENQLGTEVPLALFTPQSGATPQWACPLLRLTRACVA